MAPLAGRPPFATDEPDSVYATSQPQARYRQPPRDDPNARTSAYDHYDGYLNNGYDSNNAAHSKRAAPAVPQPVPQQAPVPLLAPKPGYAAPIAALSMPQPFPSSHAAPQMSQFHPGVNSSLAQSPQQGAPRMPPAATRARAPPLAPIAVPSTPHPLPPTMTPILPVFVRPGQPSQTNEVKWGPEPILRGNSEEKLIPRRGERGDDFWRRFSMVAREENKKRHSQRLSPWLRETQSGKSHMAGWVWVVGIILFACAGLGIGLGLYISHKSPSNHQDPTVIGGGDRHGPGLTTSQHVTNTGISTASSSPHVSPTNTVARRAAFADPLPTPQSGTHIYAMYLSHPHRDQHGASHARRQRQHLNRALM